MLRSEYFLYRTKQLVNNFEIYYIATMNLSYSRKTYGYEISFKTHFCENQTKNVTTKIFTNFREIFGAFSVNFRQAVGDSYLNRYPTILAITELRSNTPFRGLWIDLELSSQIASCYLAIQQYNILP